MIKLQAKQLILWIIYAIHLYVFYFIIIWNIGYQLREKCEGNWRCSHYLQPAASGRYWIDGADHQWREFRNHLVLLSIVAIGTSLLDRLCYRLKMNVALPRMLVGIFIILVQHQYYAIITLTLALIGYCIPRMVPSPTVGKTLTWIWAVFVLLLKESYRIQHRPGWTWLRFLFLQRFSGMYNWRLPANFLVLRMISYNIDYYNTVQAMMSADSSVTTTEDNNSVSPTTRSTNQTITPTSSSKSNRSSSNKDPDFLAAWNLLEQYNFINYFSYISYAPLYMAGPIITYSNYLNYQTKPQQQENLLIYTIRFIYCFALMEYLTSSFPCFAIISSNLLPHLSLIEILTTFYLLLKIMWLKFLLIWRFFRWWSILDGVNPPENMMKCMSNNYSLGQFWKYWHTSFNQWIIKYLYLPLGGKYCQIWNIWIIFSFVALWHDFEYKLFLWGLMNAFFYILEIMIVKYIRPNVFGLTSSNKDKEKSKKKEDDNVNDDKKESGNKKQEESEEGKQTGKTMIVLRLFDALFGAVYIMVLMLINLVGYSMGVGAIPIVMSKMMSWEGVKVIGGSVYFLFIGVNIMFSIEEWRTN